MKKLFKTKCVKLKVKQNFIFGNNKLFSSINKNLNEQMLQIIKINVYNGVELDLDNIFSEKKVYENEERTKNLKIAFGELFKQWDQEKMRSIYINIPYYLSSMIPFFIENRFYFHHTNENNLIMCKWLDTTVKDKIPRYAHHHIGIGACIINSKMNFLLIKEKFIPSYVKNRVRLWKFVTGLVEEGESLNQAIHREVSEEVNLNVNVHGCIIISESYPNNNKLSDICFFNFCSLVNDSEMDNILIEKDELSEAKFFDIKEIENLIHNDQTSLLTAQTFKKLNTILDFNKSFQENLDILLDGKLLINSQILNDKIKFKYLNVYH